MDIELAEKILMSLVNEGILDVVIVLECSNEESPHQVVLFSLTEYYQYDTRNNCSECGEKIKFKEAKVGFRKGGRL
ncbi:hypothetical protein [Paenibacillus sp. S29]|uniref:hypothetical protein n=2 Tax=Paenibacillus sp. S29 TaxID=3394611 RepID=UPI003AE8CE07